MLESGPANWSGTIKTPRDPRLEVRLNLETVSNKTFPEFRCPFSDFHILPSDFVRGFTNPVEAYLSPTEYLPVRDFLVFDFNVNKNNFLSEFTTVHHILYPMYYYENLVKTVL